MIGAACDESSAFAESKTVAELIPEAQLVIIHGSGQFPMLENPQTLNRVLEEFFLQQNKWQSFRPE